MIIGERLRVLRESKNLSQGDIEKRTGLLRCYISRVENGHTVPAIETLEKMARAMEIPIHELFYEGDAKPLRVPHASEFKDDAIDPNEWKGFVKQLSKISPTDRRTLFFMATKLARRDKPARLRSGRK